MEPKTVIITRPTARTVSLATGSKGIKGDKGDAGAGIFSWTDVTNLTGFPGTSTGGNGAADSGKLAVFTSAGYLGVKRLTVGSGAVKGEIREDLLRIKDSLSTYIGDISTENLTANRTYALPNKDGVFAMTSDLHSAVTVTGNGISIVGQQISLSIGTGSTQVAAGNHTHVSTDVTDATDTGTLVLPGTEKVAKWSSLGGLSGSSFKASVFPNNIELGPSSIVATTPSGTQTLVFTPGIGGYTVTVPGKTGTVAMTSDIPTQASDIGAVAATSGTATSITLNTAVTFNATSYTFGTGAADAFLTEVGGGATGIALFKAATVERAFTRCGTLLTASPNGTSNILLLKMDQSIGTAHTHLAIETKGNGGFQIGPPADGTVTGGNARGLNSVDFQTTRSSSSYVASGQYSFCAGFNNTSSGIYAFSAGLGHVASGIAAMALGQYGEVSGDYGFAVGRLNLVTATAGHAGGRFAESRVYGQRGHASANFTGNNRGESQYSRFVLTGKTTTNAAVELACDSFSGTAYVAVKSGTLMSGMLNVHGIKSDGSASAHFIRQFSIKNVGGTTAMVFTPIVIGTDYASSAVLDLTANNTGDYLSVKVTGITSETWRWTAVIEACETTFGT